MNTKHKTNFTLIELLVVMAILSILLSLLQPALIRAIYKAKTVACQTNLKSIFTGTILYTEDNNDFYPIGNIQGLRIFSYYLGGTDSNRNENDNDGLIPILEPYFGGTLNGTFMCPGAEDNSYWNTPMANGIYRNDWKRYRRVWSANVPSPYQLYYNTSTIPGSSGKVMKRLGDYLSFKAYRAGDAILNTNIVVSDMSHGGTNHVKPGFPLKEKAVTHGTLFSAPVWNNNYVFDDGSVLMYEYIVDPGAVYGTAAYQNYLKKVFAVTIYEYCNIPREYLID
jgi:prepilin-type N-terminal cleavage/methylation domain-containing protein